MTVLCWRYLSEIVEIEVLQLLGSSQQPTLSSVSCFKPKCLDVKMLSRFAPGRFLNDWLYTRTSFDLEAEFKHGKPDAVLLILCETCSLSLAVLSQASTSMCTRMERISSPVSPCKCKLPTETPETHVTQHISPKCYLKESRVRLFPSFCCFLGAFLF